MLSVDVAGGHFRYYSGGDSCTGSVHPQAVETLSREAMTANAGHLVTDRFTSLTADKFKPVSNSSSSVSSCKHKWIELFLCILETLGFIIYLTWVALWEWLGAVDPQPRTWKRDWKTRRISVASGSSRYHHGLAAELVDDAGQRQDYCDSHPLSKKWYTIQSTAIPELELYEEQRDNFIITDSC